MFACLLTGHVTYKLIQLGWVAYNIDVVVFCFVFKDFLRIVALNSI